ncbi:MAG: hypothetical protein WCI97_05800 [Bacteroidota bacterium]
MKTKSIQRFLATLTLVLGCVWITSAQSSDAPKPVISGDTYIMSSGKTVSQQQADEMSNPSRVVNQNQTSGTSPEGVNVVHNNPGKKVVQDDKGQTNLQSSTGTELQLLTVSTVVPVKPLGTDPNAIRQFINHVNGTPVTAEELEQFKMNLNGWLKQDSQNMAKLTQQQYNYLVEGDYSGLYKYYALINRTTK